MERLSCRFLWPFGEDELYLNHSHIQSIRDDINASITMSTKQGHR